MAHAGSYHMADETKSWLEIAVAVFASSGLYALIQYFLGGRRKEGSESDKIKAETDALKFKSRIEKEDYYEKKFAEALLMIEDLQKKNKAVQEENLNLQDALESLKRTLTMLRIQLNNK